jgi:hypothetical protein
MEVKTPPPAVVETKAVTAPVTPSLSGNDANAARESLRKQLEQAEANATAPEARTTTAPANASADREAKARAEAEKKRREQEKRAMKNGTPAAPVVQMPQVESRFPASKSQRLAELLEKYRRDQLTPAELTPAEYHSQRAKILADQN